MERTFVPTEIQDYVKEFIDWLVEQYKSRVLIVITECKHIAEFGFHDQRYTNKDEIVATDLINDKIKTVSNFPISTLRHLYEILFSLSFYFCKSSKSFIFILTMLK